MLKVLISILVIILTAVNLFLLFALNHGEKSQAKHIKQAIDLMSVTMILDILFTIGGLIFW